MTRLYTLGRKLRPIERDDEGLAARPDWVQACPSRIDRVLGRALARPSGGWYVVDASRCFADRPRRYQVAGRDLVLWRCGDQVRAAPEACPHMGAPLSEGFVRDGRLVCPWHGLALGPEGHGSWRCFDAFDDGVLVWVRLGTDEEATREPILTERPAVFMDGVIRVEARCDPSDVIANRLDPWHGVHFHPHSFGRLKVIDEDEDSITVRVAYRVLGPLSIEVDARFHSPEPRTIAMTIIDGEGAGSVVETHATPIAVGRTAIVEATLATSERAGFRRALPASRLIRPFIERAARRLWLEDAAYAERRFALRRSEVGR